MKLTRSKGGEDDVKFLILGKLEPTYLSGAIESFRFKVARYGSAEAHHHHHDMVRFESRTNVTQLGLACLGSTTPIIKRGVSPIFRLVT